MKEAFRNVTRATPPKVWLLSIVSETAMTIILFIIQETDVIHVPETDHMEELLFHE
jgi:hypothetical protein